MTNITQRLPLSVLFDIQAYIRVNFSIKQVFKFNRLPIIRGKVTYVHAMKCLILLRTIFKVSVC